MNNKKQLTPDAYASNAALTCLTILLYPHRYSGKGNGGRCGLVELEGDNSFASS